MATARLLLLCIVFQLPVLETWLPVFLKLQEPLHWKNALSENEHSKEFYLCIIP